jgi:hypothetical protein
MTNNQLTKQVMVYSVSTDAFFNEEENKISQVLMDLRLAKSELEKVTGKTKNTKKTTETFAKLLEIFNGNDVQVDIADMKDVFEKIDKLVDSLGTKLKLEIGKKKIKSDEDKPEQEPILPRSLRRDHIITYSKKRKKEVNKTNNVVALFESALTRTMNLSNKKVNDEIIIVKAYHYNILEDLILNGFKYGDDKEYVFFSASSGQMKKKKCVFIRKDMWETHQGTFLCGLTWDRINSTKFKKGDKTESGINISKFLAYLSLLNTATTKMTNFNINKVVVVPDLEMNVKGMLQFIDHKTYIMDKPEIKSVPMNVSDGVGICLPSFSKKCFQIRANWTKGLVVPFDFKAFAKTEAEGNYTVTDVWGNPHHVINDDVQIILSASQMKTWKYYKDMDELRKFFNDNNCEAGKTNEEVETKDIHLNYQYIQSLTNMKKSDLMQIAETTNNDIEQIGSNLEVMLRSIGATKENDKKDALQSSIFLYNNLLNDPYVKEMIKSKKAAMVRDGKAGSLRIEEGKRMFIIPDLYGYCEFLFKGDKNPKGLLGDGEVFGNKIPSGNVNIMRSPALSREHGYRESIKNDKLKKWFITGGLLISNHDLLGRLIQADFDGDQVNVCWHKTFVEKCEEAMRNVYPLYYNMATAPIQQINEQSIYTSLISSFGGSIGIISNQITKIWNSAGGFTEDKLTAIKLLCMYNNFMIDACKTNFLPKPPTHIKKDIKEFTSDKTPYFFRFAKGKKMTEVAKKVLVSVKRVDDEKNRYFKVSKHTPVVNMLSDIITKKNITFKSVTDKMDYKMLMSVNMIKSKGKLVDDIIKETYETINRSKKWMLDKESDDYKDNKYTYIAKVIKDEIMEMVHYVDEKVTIGYVVNVLVEYLYKTKEASNKKTLWESFGDIIFANLKFNLEGLRDCGCCGDEFKPESHKDKYCSDGCKIKMNSQLTNNNAKKSRSKNNLIEELLVC